MPVETAADLAAFFDADEFAAAAVYTPPGGGAAQTVTGLFDLKAPFAPIGEGANAVIRERRFIVPKSAFAPAPAKNGTLVIDGVPYRVRAVADWEDDPGGTIYALPLHIV